MTEQLALFPRPTTGFAPRHPTPDTQPKTAPYQRHSETSKAAAVQIKLTAATLREKVFSAIRRAGPNGLTDLEVQEILHMDGNTQRPRRVELKNAGKIKPNGKRRTPSGRAATVWIAAKF